LVYKQNNELKNQLAIAQNEIDIGYKLLSTGIYNVHNDNLITINPDKQKTILYFFSTKCKVCNENKKYWNYLVRKFSQKYRIYTIALDNKTELKSYSEEMPKGTEVYYLKNNLSGKKILRTPTTLIIDNDYVEKKWLGLLSLKNIESL